jgi:hypothetical protein
MLYDAGGQKQGEFFMKVADLTIDELKKLIREAVSEQFNEMLFDPDNGLELKDEVEQRLRASLTSKERIPLEKVRERLGL